jgi:hypothetical protein
MLMIKQPSCGFWLTTPTGLRLFHGTQARIGRWVVNAVERFDRAVDLLSEACGVAYGDLCILAATRALERHAGLFQGEFPDRAALIEAVRRVAAHDGVDVTTWLRTAVLDLVAARDDEARLILLEPLTQTIH